MEVLFDIQPEPLAEVSLLVVIAVAVMLMNGHSRIVQKHPDGDQARNSLVTVSGSMTQLDVALLMIDRSR